VDQCAGRGKLEQLHHRRDYIGVQRLSIPAANFERRGTITSNAATLTVTPPVSVERVVTVSGGYGSGSYRPGATVHVWSAAST
jgi:hypothetical protein